MAIAFSIGVHHARNAMYLCSRHEGARAALADRAKNGNE